MKVRFAFTDEFRLKRSVLSNQIITHSDAVNAIEFGLTFSAGEEGTKRFVPVQRMNR